MNRMFWGYLVRSVMAQQALIGDSFHKFLRLHRNVVELDVFLKTHHITNPHGKIADFILDGDYILEMKAFDDEFKNYLREAIEELEEQGILPPLYGTMPFEYLIKDLPNRREIKENLSGRATRRVKNFIKDANGQIEATKKLWRNEHAKGVVLVLNESDPILMPQLVIDRFRSWINGQRKGIEIFIDIFIYIDVTNFAVIDEKITKVFIIEIVPWRFANEDEIENCYIYFENLIKQYTKYKGGTYTSSPNIDFDSLEFFPYRK